MPTELMNTDKVLIGEAMRVPLQPPRDRAVFYGDAIGRRRSETFLNKNRGYVRLDELLDASRAGRALLQHLKPDSGRQWSECKEVWMVLSMRLAEAASGVVNCFGPDRLMRPEGLDSFRHIYNRDAYAHTFLEKCELPILENSVKVTRIYLNGKLLY